MRLRNRITAAHGILERSRAALAAFEDGRSIGLSLASAPGISPPKPASACQGVAGSGVAFQRHGGK